VLAIGDGFCLGVKAQRTCCRTSAELVHPISGSIALGDACSKSSTHDLVWAMDRMAFLAGPYMRAVVMLLSNAKGPPPVHHFAFTVKMRRMTERGSKRSTSANSKNSTTLTPVLTPDKKED
jgi:hypothetical protein